MSGEGDGFLNRWSRRKREAVEPKPASPPTEETEAAVNAEPDAFDPASLEIPLPSLDDLKPGDTLTAFMQKGVPEALRNAALRKMWALDPMVRDFKSEALDYAWDWNTPGGVPGSGPLGPADQVQEMVEALFRPSQEAPEDEGAALQTEEASAAVMPSSTRTGPDTAPEALPAETDDSSVSEAETAPEAPESSEMESKSAETGPRKRHGGAMPQV